MLWNDISEGSLTARPPAPPPAPPPRPRHSPPHQTRCRQHPPHSPTLWPTVNACHLHCGAMQHNATAWQHMPTAADRASMVGCRQAGQELRSVTGAPAAAALICHSYLGAPAPAAPQRPGMGAMLHHTGQHGAAGAQFGSQRHLPAREIALKACRLADVLGGVAHPLAAPAGLCIHVAVCAE